MKTNHPLNKVVKTWLRQESNHTTPNPELIAVGATGIGEGEKEPSRMGMAQGPGLKLDRGGDMSVGRAFVGRKRG